MRALTILAGVMLIIAGIFCVVTPVATYMSLGWVIGIFMLVDGIGAAFTWHARHKEGLADGWALASAILSILFGVCMLGSMAFQFAVDVFLAYVIAAWLICLGGLRVATALRLRKLGGSRAGTIMGASWVSVLVGGLIMLILGVLSVFNPAVSMASVGLMIGIAALFSGMSLVTVGLAR